MEWLKRNQRILAEAQRKLPWTLGVRTVSDRMTGFSPVGLFNSTDIGGVVYAGIKFIYDPYGCSNRIVNLEQRMADEAVLINRIATCLPHHQDSLPLFEGLLVDTRNNKLAIITEDFSKGGKHPVKIQRELPDDLIRCLNSGGFVSSFTLERAAFLVDGKFRLGDLEGFFYTREEREQIKQIISSELDEYIVRVPREKVAAAFDE